MNLLLFSAQERFEENHVRFTGQRVNHLQEVLAASEGDSFRVGEINGLMGQGQLLEMSRDAAVFEIALTQAPPEKLPLVLVLALPRPKMLRRILRNVAEMGIAELHLVNSYRVEKSYWQTPALEPESVERYFLEGLSQARDTVLPNLQLHRRFKPFVEDQLPTLVGEQRALLAHPGDYPPCPRTLVEPSLLVIGTEGGFIPYEVEKLVASGCDCVSLGPRILRVENAVSALISRVSP